MGEGEDSLGGPKIQAGNFPEIKKKKGGEKLGGQPREREWTPHASCMYFADYLTACIGASDVACFGFFFLLFHEDGKRDVSGE